MLTIQTVDHLVFNVLNVEASAAWYARVLGMERQNSRSSSGDTRTSMTFGTMKINLRPVSVSQEDWFTARSAVGGAQDLCFLTTVTPGEVAAHFRQCNVDIELGPVTKKGARGAIRSVYVRDPDGNLIEVSSYE